MTSNHFIVMKFLEGPNLKSCLDNVPTENIGSLIAQLAAAAKFLEDLGYAHRDIKPENIVLLDEFSRLILLTPQETGQQRRRLRRDWPYASGTYLTAKSE